MAWSRGELGNNDLVEEEAGGRLKSARRSAPCSGGMIGFGFGFSDGNVHVPGFDARMKVRRRRWMLVGWAGTWTGRRWVELGIGVVGLAMLVGAAAAVYMHVGFGENSPVRMRIVAVHVRSGAQRLGAGCRRSWLWLCMMVDFGECIAAGLVGVFVLRVLCGRRGLGDCSSLFHRHG